MSTKINLRKNESSDRGILKTIENMKVSSQIRFGFNVIMFFIVLLGVVVLFQTDNIWQGTKGLYEHPFMVRSAIGEVKSDIYFIDRGIKHLFLVENEQERQEIIKTIDSVEAKTEAPFTTLRNSYLGPIKNIGNAYDDFITLKTIFRETIRVLEAGQRIEALNRIKTTGVGNIQVNELLGHLQFIDDFAKAKGDQFYEDALSRKNSLTVSLIIFVGIILLFSFVIIKFLLGKVRAPLSELTRTAYEFKNGNLNARSTYLARNEFGTFSLAFNDLAETVQMNMSLNEKTNNLAGLMLSEDDAKKFFHAVLKALVSHTNSHVAAAYLLSDDKKRFEHFESIGADDNARTMFAADNFEGEFGFVLASRTIQHVKNIPPDTRFLFNTISGKFIPREIITIPIIAGKEVVAIISLATVCAYSNQSLQLIDNILNTLGARVDGILSYRKMKEFSEQLKTQNLELETQKSELQAQAIELTTQNSELEMQKMQLDEVSRLKTNFLSNMSHELRTPLNSVIALSGVLHRRLSGKLPEEEYGYLEVIERNGKMLLALINDILDIARVESGREELKITKFMVHALISDIVTMIGPQAQQKNIELHYQQHNTPIILESDIGKCQHVLQNIVGNAVKFTETGAVEVAATQIGDRVEISVTDSGIGITHEDLPHIFDEFRQADGSTSRRYGGTGLGLAIAKKYASLLGGDISVKSVPGKGSTFTLRLPLCSASGKVLEVQVEPVLQMRSKQVSAMSISYPARATILLVEDSEPAIVQMKDILEECGYHILVARGGEEALMVLGKEVPDAIILDLMTPGIDGFAVLKNLRDVERTAHVPVLILTAKHVTKEDLRFLTRNNIHQLIQKGDVNCNELLGAVAAMVQRSVVSSGLSSVVVNKPPMVGKPVVLVVEDNPDSMLTMKALLTESYTVLEAIDGNRGIEIAKKLKPHLVLMDISLPGKDGIETFKSIRNNVDTSQIPVVAVTASVMTHDREAILAYGFDAYISKPVDAELLFKCIRGVLYGI